MVGPDSIAAVARAEKVGYIFVLMPGTTCHVHLIEAQRRRISLEYGAAHSSSLGGGSGSHTGLDRVHHSHSGVVAALVYCLSLVEIEKGVVVEIDTELESFALRHGIALRH